MRERLIALRERRAELLVRAAAERAELAGWIARTDALAGWASAGASLLAELKRHPLWIALAAALLALLRPRRVVKWLATGWSLWRVARVALAWWRRFAVHP
ncbi:MAG: hypothetical protein A3G83_01255 [Betaproteobacteria bacterium RIFCSPLOWO2_12_FULL_68_20]|nr:MAG: hypothetical protein A3G83_01255 [Betaproteobacteria bacterium RIFCSPLOWO2_12_FULL_68_20]